MQCSTCKVEMELIEPGVYECPNCKQIVSITPVHFKNIKSQENLTNKEKILKLLEHQNLTSNEIATKLNISEQDARTYLLRLKKKNKIYVVDQKGRFYVYSLNNNLDQKHLSKNLHKRLDHLEEQINKLIANTENEEFLTKNNEFLDFNTNKMELLELMKKILSNSLKNVNIIVPEITDLYHLSLYEVRSSIELNIACSIDFDNIEHQDLFNEFKGLDNIHIKNYDKERDRFALFRDGEELLWAIKTNNKDNYYAILINDDQKVSLLNHLMSDYMQLFHKSFNIDEGLIQELEQQNILETSTKTPSNSDFLSCPMCGSLSIIKTVDQSKIVSYSGETPIFATSCLCRHCGYKF